MSIQLTDFKLIDGKLSSDKPLTEQEFDILHAHLFIEWQKAISTLQNIANPIKYLQDEATAQGGTLNGGIAMQLSNDANFIKQLAKSALNGLTQNP